MLCNRISAPETPPRRHLVAERGVPVDEPQHVTVDAAARRQLGEDGRLHLLLPLPDDHLARLPLAHHLLVALADLAVNLQIRTVFEITHCFCPPERREPVRRRRPYLAHVLLGHAELVVTQQERPHLLPDVVLHAAVINQPQQLQLLVVLRAADQTKEKKNRGDGEKEIRSEGRGGNKGEAHQ